MLKNLSVVRPNRVRASELLASRAEAIQAAADFLAQKE